MLAVRELFLGDLIGTLYKPWASFLISSFARIKALRMSEYYVKQEVTSQ
jgi:hypothetical protein